MYLHSQPQQCPLTHLTAFLLVQVSPQKRWRVFHLLVGWSQVNHCSTSFLGENSQSSFNLIIGNLEIIKHLFEICDHHSLFSIVKLWILFQACFVNGAPAHIGTQCYLEC